MVRIEDDVVFSTASLLGNVGVALTTGGNQQYDYEEKAAPSTEIKTNNIKAVSFGHKNEDMKTNNIKSVSIDHKNEGINPSKASSQKPLVVNDDEVEEVETSNVDALFYNRYDVGKTIGKGAFSVVKECKLKSFNTRLVAVKIVDKASLLEEEQARLEVEIFILREVKHENVLFVHDIYDEPQAFYLVSELMHGGDLLARLDRHGFLQEHEAHRVAKLVINAVFHIHEHKIAHRDLKPENILFSSNEDNAQVKLADFGFAKKETNPDSFATMCGSPSYVAPEILKGIPYGCKVDMWSFGIILWTMLVGYQPFRGDTNQELRNAIKNGAFVFDEEFWKDIDEEAKQFISSLLTLDPSMRLSADSARSHRWLSSEKKKCDRRSNSTKVFFMIGSQRSGSNWLRTMLNEREDLTGPHPPHMIRDIMPSIDKFGDLSKDENFRVLVDHVCTFVERNQVPWTDKHSSNVKFIRPIVYACAKKSCMRVRRERLDRGDGTILCKGMYLLSVFDAIMTFYTKVNGKHTWMCKSMGMSKYHDLLLEYYGPKRLRYVYLVRDPRDVAMSFMKTPVGDCHWHAIVTKWTKLQHHALCIVEDYPNLVYRLHYESILENKENEVKNLYDFIGERRFGGVKRQASVLYMDNTENKINNAKNGSEAQMARHLSYQFKNLGRGLSFAKNQNQKWRHPVTGMKNEEIQILETVAHEMMARLGYQTHFVGVTTEPTVWNDDDLIHLEKLNREGILKMKEDLAKENPDDLARRIHQASALDMKPIYHEADWEGKSNPLIDEEMWMRIESFLDESEATNRQDDIGLSTFDDIFKESMSASFRNTLNCRGISKRRLCSGEKMHVTKNGVRVRWASGTQSGYYADQHNKPNQDRHVCQTGMTEERSIDWFGVYDGNGVSGHECAEFTRTKLPKLFEERVASGQSLLKAMKNAHMEVHKQLIANENIETDISGTTATTLLLVNDRCIISNVGDSPAILGLCDGTSTSAHRLCREHTPMHADERERIKRAGGVVMSVDQRDGLAPIHENWQADEIPRVWSTEEEKFPGCAFTRSIGSGIAHTLGVTARPEFNEHIISKNDQVLIVASDGITEFIDDETCVAIACSYNSPDEAAKALIQEASERWMSRGDYMDDITAIVVFFDRNEEDYVTTCSITPESSVALPSEMEENMEESEDEALSLGIAARF